MLAASGTVRDHRARLELIITSANCGLFSGGRIHQEDRETNEGRAPHPKDACVPSGGRTGRNAFLSQTVSLGSDTFLRSVRDTKKGAICPT